MRLDPGPAGLPIEVVGDLSDEAIEALAALLVAAWQGQSDETDQGDVVSPGQPQPGTAR